MAASIGSGNSSNYKKYRDKLRSLMAGHNPFGVLYVSGLQRGRALKSCHSEFHLHHTSVRLPDIKRAEIID